MPAVDRRALGFALRLALASAAVCGWARVPQAQASPQAAERALVQESESARAAGDYDTARAKVAEAVASLLARPDAGQDADWLALLNSAGRAAYLAQDAAASAAAWGRVNEVRTRTLGEEHRDVQVVRLNLAAALFALGDLAAARDLEQSVLDVRTRTLPDDDPELQKARAGLGATLYTLGDLAGARALQEKVLEVGARTLPEDDLELQKARSNLGTTCRALGDLARARELQEQVVASFTRTLPEDDLDLQWARQNLSIALYAQGDLAGARALQEQVLSVLARVLPDDHPELQVARQNLAATLHRLGDLPGARPLFERVLAALEGQLPEEHPALQNARQNVAAVALALGDPGRARELFGQILAAREATLPDSHPDLQAARQNLAVACYSVFDLDRARSLQEQVLADAASRLPDEHPDLQAARQNLALTLLCQAASGGKPAADRSAADRAPALEPAALETARARCGELLSALCRAQVRAARDAVLGSSAREAEERCSSLSAPVDVCLSFAGGFGVLAPQPELAAEVFLLSETTRGAALAAAELARAARGSPEYAARRDELRAASDALAALAQAGASSEDFESARRRRESAERQLAEMARKLAGGRPTAAELDLPSLVARLGEHGAAVAFRRYCRSSVEIVPGADWPAMRSTDTESLCAFVVRKREPTLTVVDLGPVAPIETAVDDWRRALGVSGEARGGRVEPAGAAAAGRDPAAALGHALVDPLRPALEGADRVVVALDDVLHLVPLDALPFDESSLVGEHWRIETRSTLAELVRVRAPLAGDGRLLAVGGVDYGGPAAEAGAVASARSAAAWSAGFSPLPSTGPEVAGLAERFRDRFGDDAPADVLQGTAATRERLFELAPRSRWLHVATHGWFAPESIRSWSDPRPLDERSGAARLSGEEQVKGMSPMLLAGLALAGANEPPAASGRAPGLVTADELATLDLTSCELAVLSACDTNVGVRRAGQGVASLQQALHMAGARTVLTSLWKVPDQATKELMLDFYRRMWVEQTPKAQALWEAKRHLREAQDEAGAPKYTTRDWAGWVLTGESE